MAARAAPRAAAAAATVAADAVTRMAVEHALVLLQLEVGVAVRLCRARADTLRLVAHTTVAVGRAAGRERECV